MTLSQSTREIAEPGRRLIEGDDTETVCRECLTAHRVAKRVPMWGPVKEGKLIAFICPECGFVATYVAHLQVYDNFWSNPRKDIHAPVLSPELRQRLRDNSKFQTEKVRIVLEAA